VSAPTGPTVGRRGGEHRVLEPPGAPPLTAGRLDALAELWDGEVRLELEAVVLTRLAHGRWTERLGPDPARLTAAFVETIAERGGLGEEARDATLIGRVAAVGPAHPHPVTVGERVAVAFPAPAVPLFAIPDGSWDGSRVVPLGGHAVVPAGAVTVPVGDAPPALAALVAATAHLPAALASGSRTVVVGIERPAGAVAVAVLASQLRAVTAVVGSLATARLARALGADATVIAALDEPVEEAERVVRSSGGRPDLVVLADPAGAALAARVAPAVQLLTGPGEGTTADLVDHARAAGRDVAVHLGVSLPPDRGAALHQLLTEGGVLLATMRWQAGLAGLPTVPATGDDLEPT
jgi:L-erythro-3,5-diaminohexanoate dehydrogenase